MTPNETTDRKLGDYDEWYQPCENCGHDPGKTKLYYCWRCGRRVYRDFSDRALKPEIRAAIPATEKQG